MQIVKQLLLWSLGIALLVWALSAPDFRDAEGFLKGEFCLPLSWLLVSPDSSWEIRIMRNSDPFVIAAWTATIFGLMEGVILVIWRAYPAILAPYKVSADVLWIAPALNLVLFSIAAASLLLLAKLVRKRLNISDSLIIYGAFFFLGLFAVISVPKIIHLVSAAVLSLGLAAAACRKLYGFEIRLTAFLRRRLVWVPVLIVAAALGVFGYEWAREFRLSRQLPAAPAGAANVLVIVLDTVRYDRFTRAADRSLTPRLDQIAAKGVSFENAWSTTSWSLPSQASILTGRYPHEHGADWPKLQLDEKYATLGEFFSRRGYVTGAFSGNASWVTPEYLGRGFLRFDVYKLEDILRRTAYGRVVGRLLWEIGYHSAGRGKKAPEVNAQFLKFLDDYPERPFLAYLCYMDVNQAFHNRRLNRAFWTTAPSVQEVVEAYDRGLKSLDRQIGDLFTELAKRDVLKNTLLIITSDHGESFGAQRTDDHDPSGHGTSLYPEQTKVPLFVIYPGKLHGQRRIKATVTIRQIPKTITQLLDIVDSPFVGQALPVESDDKNPPDQDEAAVLATLKYDNQRVQSVIWHPWQYINNLNDPRNGEELYDLARDPLAKNNLKPKLSIARQIAEILEKLLNTGSETLVQAGRVS
jgi:arylsulfatase A-like enzyme